MNLNPNFDLSRAYWIKATSSNSFSYLSSMKNANNANFGSFEKPLSSTKIIL